MEIFGSPTFFKSKLLHISRKKILDLVQNTIFSASSIAYCDVSYVISAAAGFGKTFYRVMRV